mmetsp:Transcript_16621/g.51534  ORF Transcript_16621/g.51534 Transcript_16621/m.51534 type:complete len:281 (+) Transcript_16621:1106-1948(+)
MAVAGSLWPNKVRNGRIVSACSSCTLWSCMATPMSLSLGVTRATSGTSVSSTSSASISEATLAAPGGGAVTLPSSSSSAAAAPPSGFRSTRVTSHLRSRRSLPAVMTEAPSAMSAMDVTPSGGCASIVSITSELCSEMMRSFPSLVPATTVWSPGSITNPPTRSAGAAILDSVPVHRRSFESGGSATASRFSASKASASAASSSSRRTALLRVPHALMLSADCVTRAMLFDVKDMARTSASCVRLLMLKRCLRSPKASALALALPSSASSSSARPVTGQS